MINIGEQIVASYLRYRRGCEFIQTNLYTVDAQGEIDVVGMNLKDKKVYLCEVAVHLSTGLQYTKDKRPNNIQKLTEKFSRDIEYARKYFPEYESEFMLWSPIVKQRGGNTTYDQIGHLRVVGENIQKQYGVTIEFVVNERFQNCMNELREFSRTQTAELKCPVMRLFQVEELLARHLKKVS